MCVCVVGGVGRWSSVVGLTGSSFFLFFLFLCDGCSFCFFFPTPFPQVAFVARAPKFYPHKPLHLRLKAMPEFPLANSIELVNGNNSKDLTVTFPMIGDDWSPTYSLYDLVVHLACLVYEDEGGGALGGEMELDQVAAPPYVANLQRFNAIIDRVPHVIQQTSVRGGGGGGGGGGFRPKQ